MDTKFSAEKTWNNQPQILNTPDATMSFDFECDRVRHFLKTVRKYWPSFNTILSIRIIFLRKK